MYIASRVDRAIWWVQNARRSLLVGIIATLQVMVGLLAWIYLLQPAIESIRHSELEGSHSHALQEEYSRRSQELLTVSQSVRGMRAKLNDALATQTSSSENETLLLVRDIAAEAGMRVAAFDRSADSHSDRFGATAGTLAMEGSFSQTDRFLALLNERNVLIQVDSLEIENPEDQSDRLITKLSFIHCAAGELPRPLCP